MEGTNFSQEERRRDAAMALGYLQRDNDLAAGMANIDDFPNIDEARDSNERMLIAIADKYGIRSIGNDLPALILISEEERKADALRATQLLAHRTDLIREQNCQAGKRRAMPDISKELGPIEAEFDLLYAKYGASRSLPLAHQILLAEVPAPLIE